MSLIDTNPDSTRPYSDNHSAADFTPVYARNTRKTKGLRTWMILTPIAVLTLGGLGALALTQGDEGSLTDAGATPAFSPIETAMMEAPLTPVAPTAPAATAPAVAASPAPPPAPVARQVAPVRRAAPMPAPTARATSPTTPAAPAARAAAPVEPVGPQPYVAGPAPVAAPAPVIVIQPAT